ncbi:MAG: phosphate ABC transporter, permease protein PstA [Deltaproteobacteria bacterium HGW-Deltaproteobacteria-14]|jgi:phosphate transport system permease protein|nr:MAG: phosphate ABC transporter, permease protein PstA [Deltaproteobacteria bacterium HGW-Deltaproteobacteria-14]
MSVDLQPSGRAHDIRRRGNNLGERAFIALSVVAIAVPLLILGGLVVNTLGDAIGRLDWDFITSYPSRRASAAGILPALIGSLWLIGLTAVIALPLGVGAALWLEEYGGKSRLAGFIEVNIANLAGVPSIIYGLLGLGLFVRFLGLGRSVLAGALTLSLLVMPIVIIATREALRTVPGHLREAAAALGATRWQVIRQVILPMSLPGIMTGAILSISRAIGETAPLIVVGALTYVTFLPAGPGDPFTALPIQIYNWVSRPQEAFLVNAAAGIMVLLVTMLVLNSVAVLLRNRLQRRTRR